MVLNSVLNMPNSSFYRYGNGSSERILDHILHSKAALNVLLDHHDLSSLVFDHLVTSLMTFEDDIKGREGHRFHAEEITTGMRGRPKLLITREQLQMFQKLYEEGLKPSGRYSNITDEDLAKEITSLHNQYPNAGSLMMSGYLEGKGIKVQRHRVRSTLNMVDPPASRIRQGIRRRQYSVPCPNSLWHVDGHMKLIRWKIATHGAIDGHSRLILYLSSSPDNKSSTVFHKFVTVCTKYGLPARVRSDHGREHVDIGLFMNIINGPEANSMLTGRSVHNQRIERLWKDVYEQVIHLFYQLFYSMEDQGQLDVESPVHIYALHFVFLPILNSHLEVFRLGWNKHKMRTEQSKTPEQLWLNGLLENLSSPFLAVSNIFSDTSLDTSLLNSLRTFDIGVEDVQGQDELPDNGTSQVLNDKQKREMQRVVDSTEDYRNKFLKCIETLAIFFLNLQ